MLNIAQQRILVPYGLTEEHLQQVLHQLHKAQIDYADLYFQIEQSSSLSLEDSIVKSATFQIDHGVGVRAVSGEKTGFAYANDFGLSSLHEAATTARSIAQLGGSGAKKITAASAAHDLYGVKPLAAEIDQSAWVNLLQSIDRFARQLDPRVHQVMASVASSEETILIVASDGTYCGDIRPLVRLNVTVVVEENGHRETGFSGGGGRYAAQDLLQESVWQNYVKEAVRIACLNLKAVEAPAGTMDVVLGNGWTGVLLHEAVGHGLEGDFNRKGTSAFAKLMGQSIASPLCTVVDDGTLAGRRGSLNCDDEGTPTQRTVLIENGKLTGYMQDKLNSRLMKGHSTGNARRESYASIPMPRMTNTYMLPGEHSPEEMIRSVKKGLYAVNFSGGQVDITSGKYVFVANEAYLIENGKITSPVKNATLIGDGPTALTQIAMVGNDLALDPGIGVCGKEGQSVPVGVGMPTVLMRNLTVGGTGG